MKKIFILISLMSVILVSCDQKPDTPLAEEVEQVTDVTFLNPQVSIANSTVTYSVTVSSSKGEETVFYRMPIEYAWDRNSCYNSFYPEIYPEISAPIICEVDNSIAYFRRGLKEEEWLWTSKDYLIQLNSYLPDMKYSNTVTARVPKSISVTIYGKTFHFDNVVFTASADSNIRKVEDKLTIQEISVHLYYGNYRKDVMLRNELYTD